jgi:hypothetical protein
MFNLSSIHRSFGTLVVSSVLVGCASGAEWNSAQVASGYQPAKQLSVSVVVSAKADQAESAELQEAVQEFTTTLKDELKSQGIDASVRSSTAAPPAAQLDVVEWEPGSRAARYFVGFGAGEGHILIAVHVTRADGGSALQGQVRGYVKGGWWGGSPLAAPREAAKTIASAIATGNAH